MNTLQDETNGWLQTNSRSLLFLAALLLGGGAVTWYLPRAAAAGKQASWQRYSDFQQALMTADTEDDLNAALAAVESDDRVYPWALSYAVTWAAQMSKDDATLALLENRLTALPDGSTGAKVLNEGASVDVVDAVEARVKGLKAISGLKATPIEPAGSKVRVSLTDADGKIYAMVYQLYEEQAPVASAWLLGLIDAGSFSEVKLVPSPQNGFQIDQIPAAEEATNLTIEKTWGVFHGSGTLCTMLESGGDPGDQSLTRLQFLGRDIFGQDGVTTVIGKIIEGEDQLEAIGELERSTEDSLAFASAMTLTIERVAE
jgi:hypothetical protein